MNVNQSITWVDRGGNTKSIYWLVLQRRQMSPSRFRQSNKCRACFWERFSGEREQYSNATTIHRKPCVLGGRDRVVHLNTKPRSHLLRPDGRWHLGESRATSGRPLELLGSFLTPRGPLLLASCPMRSRFPFVGDTEFGACSRAPFLRE